jgi:hypothetical protein
MASRSDPQLEERFDAPAAVFESGKQLTWGYISAVNRSRDREPVFLTEGLDPHAPDVVQMSGDHADTASRCLRQASAPESTGQVLHKVRGYAVVSPPSGQKRFRSISEWWHCEPRVVEVLTKARR